MGLAVVAATERGRRFRLRKMAVMLGPLGGGGLGGHKEKGRTIASSLVWAWVGDVPT